MRTADLEQEMASALASALSCTQWLDCTVRQGIGPSEPDLVVELACNGAASPIAALQVDIEANMRPSNFSRWLQGRPETDGTATILAMPSVSNRMAQLCREASVSWIDLAGNFCIDAPGVLHLERRGRTERAVGTPKLSQLKSPASGRVVRALLSPVHASMQWTQRSLQAATAQSLPDIQPVSLGLVNKVIARLRDDAFVTTNRGEFHLTDPESLLKTWAAIDHNDHHKQLPYFTLMNQEQFSAALEQAQRELGPWCIRASFSAAEHQAPHVRQPRHWLHLRPSGLQVLERLTKAKRVDSGENLTVYVSKDPGVFQRWTAGDDRELPCTDPVQTYVDLLRHPGRGAEAAQAIKDQLLLPAWQAAGIA